MPIENASFIKDLDPDQPQGNESISEGDDHLRVIKYALTKSFPNVDGEVDWTPQDFADVKGRVVGSSNGVFASCKFNGSSVMYGHNVNSVQVVNNGQYQVNFTQPTDGFDNHYAIQVTPIATNNRAVIACVNDQDTDHVGFAVKEESGGSWGVPVGPIGFYMTMVDMIQTEANSDT